MGRYSTFQKRPLYCYLGDIPLKTTIIPVFIKHKLENILFILNILNMNLDPSLNTQKSVYLHSWIYHVEFYRLALIKKDFVYSFIVY